MRKRMARLMFVMPRLIFETLSILMLFMIIKSIFNHFDIGYIAVISVGMMTVSYQLNKWLTFKRSLMIGGAAALAFGLTHAGFSLFFRIIYALYYLYIWFVGLRLNVEHEYPAVYMKKFFLNSFAMVVMMTTVGLSNIFYYINELSMYFVIYAVSIMLYIGKINIESVYAERDANEISGKSKNKYKGIIINMLVIVLIVFLIAGALVENAGLFRDVFEIALRPVGYFGERISRFIESKLIERSSEMGDGSLMGSADEVTEMMEDYQERRTWRSINVKWILQILFVAGALAGIVLYARRLFRNERISETQEEDYYETRESVFSRKLLYDNTIGKILGNVARLFPQKKKNLQLEIIRQKYLDTVVRLIGSGQEIMMSDTPDEILRKVVLSSDERLKFDDLTQIYKQCRYSSTRPGADQISRIAKLEILSNHHRGGG